MRNLITLCFCLSFGSVFILTLLVGFAWLFDLRPVNLYAAWKISGMLAMISFILQLLFGKK